MESDSHNEKGSHVEAGIELGDQYVAEKELTTVEAESDKWCQSRICSTFWYRNMHWSRGKIQRRQFCYSETSPGSWDRRNTIWRN